MSTSITHAVPFIVRGDLRSETGYARAARALTNLVARFPDIAVFGIDLHPNPADCGGNFAHMLIDESQMWQVVRQSTQTPIVLHYTGIDDFVQVPGAVNIGAFYWETDTLVHQRHWPLRLAGMDRIWAPTSFLGTYARASGFTGDVTVVPWPHEFPDQAPAVRPGALESIQALYFGRSGPSGRFQTQTVSLRKIRSEARNLFVSVQSLAPRKGLPILLREWRNHIDDPSCQDILVLRLAFRHAHGINAAPAEHFEAILKTIGFDGVDLRIAIIHDHLPDPQLSALYGACDSYVSASYGEGFGGPIIEAISAHRPVIAPRHTGIADLLPADHPLTVNSVRKCVGLKGNVSAYPYSSSWYLPLPGEIAGRLRDFAAMDASRRAAVVRKARQHAIDFCSSWRLIAILGDEIARIRAPALPPMATQPAQEPAMLS